MESHDFLLCLLLHAELCIEVLDCSNLRCLFGISAYRHIHGCGKSIEFGRRSIVLSLDHEPCLLVVEDVASDCLSEYFRVAICVKPVVCDLESQSDVVTELVKQLSLFSRCTTDQCTHLRCTCDKDSRLESDHLEILIHRYMGHVLKVHIVLLALADLCRCV